MSGEAETGVLVGVVGSSAPIARWRVINGSRVCLLEDLYGMYGAMDHIDQKRDKRPKGSRPEGWDVNYAKEKYERGVPAGELV